MQHPKITECPSMPAQGYVPQGGSLMSDLEKLSSEYPCLTSNRPMKIFPMTSREFAQMVNEGYE